MSGPVAVVVALGLIASAVVVVLALRAGRQPPVHRIPWVLALVALGGSVLFHGSIAVVMLTNADGWSGVVVGMGTIALAGALLAAVWRAAWGGWLLIATAALQPALLWLLQAVTATSSTEGLPPEGMAMTYSVPAVITGVLLLISAWRPRAVPSGTTPASVQ